MSDLHQFPDSLERLINAGEDRAAELDAAADAIRADKPFQHGVHEVDPARIRSEMRAEANQLRDDARRWRSVLEAARRFGADLHAELEK